MHLVYVHFLLIILVFMLFCAGQRNSQKTSDKEDITIIQTFVADLKEMAKLEYEKQLIDDQAKEEEVKAYESVKSVKDVGIDPIQESPESPSQWPLEFERKQRYIIELWHFCCISLVH
ncbi:putative inactive kinesin-like protein KIN-7B [Papaver somniferum]|uniref:putative inactive kinesin-like protein KIN-7B n=1 Tax=Papaver somniferum TaxID=3469 RepID=UPI000E6F6E14|nr:putative inactive kinesin-like protein KIN-7B [Papaver somniferum]